MERFERRLSKLSPAEIERIKARMFKQMRDATPHRATIVLSQKDSKLPNDLTYERIGKEIKLAESSYRVSEDEILLGADLAREAMDEKSDEENQIEGF